MIRNTGNGPRGGAKTWPSASAGLAWMKSWIWLRITRSNPAMSSSPDALQRACRARRWSKAATPKLPTAVSTPKLHCGDGRIDTQAALRRRPYRHPGCTSATAVSTPRLHCGDSRSDTQAALRRQPYLSSRTRPDAGQSEGPSLCRMQRGGRSQAPFSAPGRLLHRHRPQG